ncbi:Pre-mRNA-splicing ATP-dependent RNA helicase prp28 [Penicillium maclennaniae]|uniref:Pre-mRNA-splicing ATP-dependent RNA helicase prp28 n=1 Tax=Penicillium maclennaniae TaxID=1343394 RepID=UPI00253FD036|nr:Pre-mRNA-splicing ATP-dependent RNA helicase prp28 [Penicillium maclennaniae]KAJ5681934.1 Pre-mRNA-splicing ATP-dependent RNA helicase prp28 [Penicillium maclennaniae]
MATNGFDGLPPGPPPDPIERPPSPPPPPPEDLAAPPPPPDAAAPPPPPDDAPPAPPVEAKKKKSGWGAPKRPAATPLSVEELIRKKKEADAAASKPKFLSKAQREKLALEKRAKEVEAERQAKASTNGADRDGFSSETPTKRPEDPRHDTRDSNGRVPTGPRAMRGDIPTGPASQRNSNGYNNRRQDSEMPPPQKGKGSKTDKRPAEEDETEAQAALVKQRYMGVEQRSTFSAKNKRKRTTDRKFNFEWNTEEDTSLDYNPLYQHRHEANFFGRGRLAGFGEDVADSVARKYAQALETRDAESGGLRAKEILEMERRRREESSRSQLDKHWSEKSLANMRERDWRIFKEDFNISTKGGGIPNPMRSWEESDLPRRLLELIDRVGYKEPSPIQRAAIPIALQNRDLIGVAVTGSGKTAAFLLPLLVYISELPRLDEFEWRKNDGPYALVLAPTRELAQQIEIEARKFTAPLGFNVVSIVGGHSLEEQAYSLRNGAELIIATPGRLVDCIERRMLVLSQCCYVIMDEADRMVDMGFEESVNKILDALPSPTKSQTPKKPRIHSQ